MFLWDSILETGLFGLVLGSLFGAVFAIWAVNLISPWLICRLHGTHELREPAVLDLVYRRLEQAGLPRLRVDVWPLQKIKAVNALAVGLIHAPKIFRARILISDSLITHFSREELDAVIAHEVSHFRQNHLSRRIWIPFFAYLFVVFGGSSALMVPPFDDGLVFFSFIALVGVAYVLSFSVLIKKLSRAQELDADWVAIHKLGVNPDLYFKTIEKMMLFENPQGLKVAEGQTHPLPQERREQVQIDPHGTQPPFEQRLIIELRYGAALIAVVFALSGLFFRVTMAPQGQRVPAANSSESKN